MGVFVVKEVNIRAKMETAYRKIEKEGKNTKF